MINAGYLKAIDSSGSLPVLPPGTYVPNNSISGPFDLLWENRSSNANTGSGYVESTVSDPFMQGASFKVNHHGDFKLNFYFNSENLIAGICYFKDNGITFNTYTGIDHSILQQSGGTYIFGNGQTHYQESSTSLSSQFTISRTGTLIEYSIDAHVIYSQTADFAAGFLFNCSMGAIGKIFDIEIIIP